jgi:hypothetical protein
VCVKISQKLGLPTLYLYSSLRLISGLFILVGLSTCQGPSRLEDCIPANTLAIVPFVDEKGTIPFDDRDWHKVLLPLTKQQTGILYLSLASKNHQAARKNYASTSTTELRGVSIQHFYQQRGSEEWSLAQLNGIDLLSKQASLVEEAILDIKNGRCANWVEPFAPKQLQFFYPKLATFLGLTQNGLNEISDKVVLQLGSKSKQLAGKFFFNQNIPDYSTSILSFIPEDVCSFEPWWSMHPKYRWINELSKQPPFLAQMGAPQKPETICILPFEKADEVQKALKTLANRFGALPTIPYQTYAIQPVLDLGLDDLGIHQAALMAMDRYLIIAPSANVLERWIDAVLVGNTVQQHLKTSVKGLWVRLNREQGLGTAFALLNRELNLGFAIPTVFELQGNGNQGQWNFSTIQPFSEQENWLQMLWQTDLPAEEAVQVAALDHWNGWCVETPDHALVFLDAQGKLRWSKKLDGAIKGKIIEQPWLNQPQHHLFFATSTSIYGLQSTAEPLPGFPLSLQLPTSSGITIGGRDQFLFYACTDGRIYGLNADGSPLSGWNPGPRIGKVTQPLEFFQSATEDYLLALTDEGQLQVLNRGGQPHFSPVKIKELNRSPIYWQWDQYSKRIVFADGTGKARVVDAKGATFPLALTPELEGKTLFCMANLIGDPRYDYLAAAENQLFLHSYQQNEYKLIFQKKFDAKIGAIEVHRRGGNAIILLSIPAKHEVWAMDVNGKALPGFPVAGDKFAYLNSAKILITTIDNRAFGYAEYDAINY